MANKALLIGATGLVGNECLRQLLQDDFFDEVEIFVRKKIAISHPKLIQTQISFSELSNIPNNNATYIFCCLGTTIAKAKTKEAFKSVDYNYVVELAKLAERSHCKKFLVISSIGANASSTNFYLRTKGEMENAINSFYIPEIYIFRPSILLGKRNEFRLGELVGKFMIQVSGIFLFGKFKRYKGVQSKIVASSMIYFSKFGTDRLKIIESDKIVDASYNARNY